MAIPVYTLVNTTGSPIILVNLGLTIPASGTVDATGPDGDVSVSDFLSDPQTNSLVDAGTVTINVDAVVLTTEQSKAIIPPQRTGLAQVLHNLSGTATPTATDDEDAGYSIGSHWFDTTNDLIYFCIDDTSAAAVWEQLLTSSGGGGFVLGWGASLGGTGKFAGAWQGASGGEFSSGEEWNSGLACPKAGESSTLSWNSEGADTDTMMKIHVNGTVEATVTLTGESGSTPVSVTLDEGDVIEVEYDSGTKPDKSTWLLFVVP